MKLDKPSLCTGLFTTCQHSVCCAQLTISIDPACCRLRPASAVASVRFNNVVIKEID